jgi:hypothetical protein
MIRHPGFQLEILVATILFWPAVLCPSTLAQKPSYPKKIHGYKVERAVVEVKKQQKKSKDTTADQQAGSESETDAFIRFGDAQLARLTPLGITLEIPIVVAPVQQKGRVDFLTFEDMVVNDIPVQIDEYHRSFDLPNKEELTLREPVKFYIYLPNAVLAAIDEWSNSKERWLVTGRVYVFGNFKKSIFSFKRCIPVELSITMRNPLRE